MTASDTTTNPNRTEQHEALSAFLGSWRAEGYSYADGGAGRLASSIRDRWISTHTGRWHTGKFFLIQEEKAMLGTDALRPFETLSIMGVDDNTGNYFARAFENHGFYRHYDVVVGGRVWKLTGPTERARIEFSGDGGIQTIAWEWKVLGVWQPLCDRVAHRI